MELGAVIEAIRILKMPCEVTVFSDSAYVVNAFLQGWLNKWKNNGWRSSSGRVANQELWVELDKLIQQHKIVWVKVPGHSGDKYNERCDKLATAATQKAIEELRKLDTGSAF